LRGKVRLFREELKRAMSPSLSADVPSTGPIAETKLKGSGEMTTSFNRLAGAVAGMVAGFGASIAVAQETNIKFSLDWKFEGPAAPFLVALDKGYYKAEGLNVTIDTGAGSREPITRIASGTYDMGFGDINALVKFLDEQPNAKVKAVMVMYERPPFAVIGRKSLGVTTDPKSLAGKTLGAPPPDGAFGQWAIFQRVANIDTSNIKIESVGFPVREPMLAQGKVHAIFGFSFSSVLNLKSQGVKDEDISLILMAEHGLDLYGNSIMVNPDFAAKNPKAVQGFLKAVMKGMQDTIKDPAMAVDSVIKRNQVVTKAVELERLQMALAQNFVTPAVKKDGFGGVTAAKLDKSIELLKVSLQLKNPPKGDALFDSSFLPSAAERKVN
jgi:NitT/TauT family transport system substrate-binding protein